MQNTRCDGVPTLCKCDVSSPATQLTVVFMMPVPWVRMELATCRIFMVFRCLLLEERSTKICGKEAIMIQTIVLYFPLVSFLLHSVLPLPPTSPSFLPPPPPGYVQLLHIYLIVEVIAIACHKDMNVSHDLEDIQTLRDRNNSNYCHAYMMNKLETRQYCMLECMAIY